MIAGAAVRRGRSLPTGAVLISVALISAALIAYEIVLMRRLLIERWHHFGYLVISIALLGFGASGVWLALCERRVRKRPLVTLRRLALTLAVLLLLMPRAAALLPVSARFVPDDLWRQVGWWSLYWLAATVPFLVGAALIGAALMTAGQKVGRAYAANLFGSAAGAVAAVLVISRSSIEYALWPSTVLALLASAILARDANGAGGGRRPLIPVLVVAVLGGILEITHPLGPAYDEYKYASSVQQLVAQGSARRVAAAADPHGFVEVYESDLFHDLPFLALSDPPPPMLRVLINGDPAGSIFTIDDASQAGVMDRTLMAFPYRLIRPRPNVLLIGEIGGTNVWLARRRDAGRITVVQPNSALTNLLRGPDAPLGQRCGRVFDGADVTVEITAPRSFLDAQQTASFDLIQIASLEGLGGGSAGARGLAEDHLATVQGFTACLDALRPGGLIAVSRGLQYPPRENVRLLATWVEALESLGYANPSAHVIQVRDYLGVCTLASTTPIDDERRETLRAAIRAFNLTPVWYDGLPAADVNQPDEAPDPTGSGTDWLHHAAREIFSPRREAFYESWLLNVRPVHDDNPFFWDFYKPRAVAVLKQAYGDLWLTRAELGRLFLYASLTIASAAAIVLILLPLMLMRKRGRAPAAGDTTRPPAAMTAGTIVYFSAIGLGFMGVEMALISRAIRWLGDPVLASAVVIGGVLLVSGVGSLVGSRVLRGRVWVAPAVVAAIAGVMRIMAWNTPDGWLSEIGAPLLLALIAIPLTFFMGIPMPAGIAILNRRAPSLVPWAWGVNGVASVIATSAAIVVAMNAGYRTVVVLAAGLYVLAAVALPVLDRRDDRRASEPDLEEM